MGQHRLPLLERGDNESTIQNLLANPSPMVKSIEKIVDEQVTFQNSSHKIPTFAGDLSIGRVREMLKEPQRVKEWLQREQRVPWYKSVFLQMNCMEGRQCYK